MLEYWIEFSHYSTILLFHYSVKLNDKAPNGYNSKPPSWVVDVYSIFWAAKLWNILF